MAIMTLVHFVILVLVIFLIGYVAKWLADTFLPEPPKTVVLVVIGAILLLVLIVAALQIFGIPLK